MTMANVLGWFLLSIWIVVIAAVLSSDIHFSYVAKETLARIVLNGTMAALGLMVFIFSMMLLIGDSHD